MDIINKDIWWSSGHLKREMKYENFTPTENSDFVTIIIFPPLPLNLLYGSAITNFVQCTYVTILLFNISFINLFCDYKTKYANLNCCYNTVQNSSTWTRVIDDFQSSTSEPLKISEEHFIIYGAVLIIYAYLF